MNGVVAHGLFLLLAGFAFPYFSRRGARVAGWVLVIATTIITITLSSSCSPPVRMLMIVTLQLLAMKALVAAESYRSKNGLTFFQWLAFACGWPGMRPALFEKLWGPPIAYQSVFLSGVSRVALGLLLIYLATILHHHTRISLTFADEFLLLAGVSFVLHFGILNLMTAGWRRCGVDCPELFRSPYRARSLQEFWSKRWNLAFSEMTALTIYKPLRNRVGRSLALMIAFLFSGLLHELAITVPIQTGYGKPTVYFMIHAIAMHIEEKTVFRKIIGLYRICAHLWVMLVLVLPLPLLFPKEFITQVLVPISVYFLSIVGLA